MRYKATPTRMILPAVPHPATGAVPTAPRDDARIEMPETLAIQGLSTVPTSVNQARHDADQLLQMCKARVEAGNPSALLELLDINPVFMANLWVRETYLRLSEEGKLRRARGRPIGRDKVNPMVVIGLVGHLIETKRAENREQAFGKLEEFGLMTYAAAKDSFYRGRREQRFRSFFLAFPELDRELSAEEAAWLLRPEFVEPGRPVRRRFAHPQLGKVELTFSAG